MNSIYVHIPFCEQKCKYCAFASFDNQFDQVQKYFDALQKEIESSTFEFRIGSIFIGGGTPSAVSPSFIAEILKAIRKKFDVDKNAEITIEANPNSLNEQILKEYFSKGINRLSVGVQSLENKQLKALGRLHNKVQVFKALKAAKKVGFKNINCDLLLGLENQSYHQLKKAIKSLKKYATHFSCYMLQVEDGTPLKSMVEGGRIKLPDDDKVVKIYHKLVSFFRKQGLKQYEISNFAKKGFECLHNLNYWARGNYLGFGLGAHSFVGDTRWANASNFSDYYAGKKAFVEKLDDKQVAEEIVMLGLRCNLGFDLQQLQKFGLNLENNDQFQEFLQNNILFLQNGRVKINPDYYGVSNLIIEKLIDF